MREIKFRGIHTLLNQFITGLPAYGEDGQISMLQDFLDGDSDCYFDVRPETVGQYTGLKDKNGVEIYEGDIVLFGSSKRIIKFDRGSFTMFDGESRRSPLSDYVVEDKVEVIGNIYEHLHLITKEDEA